MNFAAANLDSSRAHSQVPSKAIVAIDMGAESCRVSLLRWRSGEPTVRLVHRFPNRAITESEALKWDLGKILSGLEIGLRHCAQIAEEGIAAIGVDGWAVDYVRLGPDGKPLGNPYCYRDTRNNAAEACVHERISRDELYNTTGVQLLPFNTLYQLCADQLQGMSAAAPWINLPEFVLCDLGGRRVAEYTNATHTQLLALGRPEWNAGLFARLGLDLQAAPPIVPPGTILGQLRGPLAALPQLRNARLIAPACHDTAAAIAAIAASGHDWAFISSGTWSLVGTVLDAPLVTAETRARNYTNLGGVGGRICFLKNVNGLWLIRQCMEEWERAGGAWTLKELIRAAEGSPVPGPLIDVDDPDLLQPGHMPSRINAQRRRTGLQPLSESPADAPAAAALIFRSLAKRYADVASDLASLTGKRLRRVFVVGGGSRNDFLNRLTAEATGLQVIKGPVEASTIGNLAVQLAALGSAYSEVTGVAASEVAHWAGVLQHSYTEDDDVRHLEPEVATG